MLYDPKLILTVKTLLIKLSIENTLDPFAGTILQDDVHEWFDLRGMEDSPYDVCC